MTSKTARTIATFVAAVAALVAAVNPMDLPPWAQGIAACLVVGFAAIGIIPPTMDVDRRVYGGREDTLTATTATKSHIRKTPGGWRN